MSLRSPLGYSLPDETARVARAAFPKGNPYLRLADALGPIFHNPDFADLYAEVGQPAEDPAQLALVTLFQFAEGLTDRQAADAVRSRIDWKYAMRLPLEDEGFDSTVLVEFRARLLTGGAERQLFDTLLDCLKAQGVVKARGRQRTDSTHVLAAVHVLNRLELVGETLRHALDVLAVAAPGWLRAWTPGEWFDRYGQRLTEYRLPKGEAERVALAEQIGADGRRLLTRLDDADAPAGLGQLPAVRTLRRVWLEEFYAGEPPRWRAAEDRPPAGRMTSSPHDPEARFRLKRETAWVGYAVHLTESCDPDAPSIITDVATAPASATDNAETDAIHERLAERGLLPAEHLVDAGYVTATTLVGSAARAVDLVGPVIGDQSWQARQATGYAVAQFTIDWEARRATCPAGRTSAVWRETRDSAGHPAVDIHFGTATCRGCPARAQCATRQRGRSLLVRRQEEFEALQAARRRQATPEFRAQYRARAGVEGTHSQGVRRAGLRRTRYRGLAKTALGHTFIAAALNLVRVAAWLAEAPRSTTRRSAFARLAPAPV
jgi:transposase